MDLPEAVKKFESVLKCRSSQKSVKLYDQQESFVNTENLKPQELLVGLTHQLNAFHKADNIKNVPLPNRTQEFKNKSRTSQFISLNMLPDNVEPVFCEQHKKFETQCVTDTQLVDIMEQAEMHIDHGITQEFDMPFQNADIDIQNTIKQNNETASDNFTSYETNDVMIEKSVRDVINNKIDNVSKKKNVTESVNTDISMVTNCTSVDINDLDDVNEELPSSPIFKSSKISQSKIKRPLVYDLESFEKFESIAVPIVEENTDKHDVTKQINSQIIDRVLFLNLHPDPLLLERDKQSSPIINIENDVYSKDDFCGRITPDKTSEGMKDELLFSSDEEEDNDNDLTPKLPSSPVEKNSDEPEDLDKSMFVGFQTASNKSIQICTDSFHTAKSLLNNIEDKSNSESLKTQFDVKTAKNDSDVLLDSPRKRKYEGFKTASNKIIKLSEAALSHCQKVFHDINLNESYDSKEESCDEVFDKLYSSKIEDDELIQEFDNVEMAHNVNIDNEENTNVNSAQLDEFKAATENTDKYFDNKNNTNICGFKTASNKELKISEAAFFRSKAIFEDFNMVEENETKQDILLQNDIFNTDKSLNFVGFQTASNKKVMVSAEALKKSKKIFDDTKDLSPIKNISDIPQKSVFKGFQTASNKEIKVSQQAVDKYKKILQDVDDFDVFQEDQMDHTDMDIAKKCTDLNHNLGRKKLFCEGFKTANNKAIKISKESFDKSKKVFESIDLDQNIKSNQGTNENVTLDSQKHCETKFNNTLLIPNSKSFHGFKTASNKDVLVSEEAIAKSKALFQNMDGDIPDTCINKNIHESVPQSKFNGFQTASNKKVEVSEKALKKTKAIFKDIELNEKLDEDSSTGKNISNFEGFKTGNNKNIRISNAALQKSRKLFEDINTVEANIEPTKQNMNKFSGFQTATNKKVVVSEQALAKSRRLLSDVRSPDCLLLEKPVTKKTEDEKLNYDIKRRNSRGARILEEALKKTNEPVKESRNAIESLIDTQVLNNFEESLCTEDFCKTPRSKRPSSPILSCPKAKRRKFETPYKVSTLNKNKVVKTPLSEDVPSLNFDTNYKKNKKYNLRDLAELEKKFKVCLNPCPPTICLDYENLLLYEFDGLRNNLSSTKLTISDILQMFLKTSDKKLIPKGWPENHVKLIIWKLISYEIKFPKVMNGICSAKTVMEQLNYRYCKELYCTERPALRKILEKDESALKPMILCVVAVCADNVKVNSVANTSSNIELLLTDGWYTIMSTLDKMLTNLVVKEKIKVGTKLAVCGAELINCEQGISPWENTSAIRLKLFGNSTRRARWDARLGFHGNGAILSRLSSVKLDGGKISKLLVFVTRVYPLLYVEKFEDGSTVTRSERLENLYQIKHENERQALMEKIYEEVEKELSSQSESQDSESGLTNSTKMESGSQIAKLMKKCNDPAEFRSTLTSSQLHQLQEHTSKRREDYLLRVQNRVAEKMAARGDVERRVTTLVKMRVAGVEERGGRVEVGRAMLSIWRPNDNVMEVMTEGTWIEAYNVVPTSIRYSELQISAGRQSIFRQSKQKHNDSVTKFTETLKRKCFNISDTTQITTNMEEIDTIGLIFQIEPSIKEFDSSKQSFQNIYLSDADKNIICINFWGGIKKFGFENVLEIGQVVAGINLQKRAGNTRKNIPQFRVTEFTYFTKTPKDGVARKLIDILENKFLGVDRLKFAEDCTILKNNYSVIKYTDNSPFRLNNSDYNITKNKIFIDSPLTTKTSKDDIDLTGLDFESSFKQTNSQTLSPNTLLRKRKVQEKIDKLKRYGEPPPISPITIINQSKCASNAFKSPLLNTNNSSSNNEVVVPHDIRRDGRSSPIISLNKTYVKRSINPVKLNFSNDIAINDSVIDQFAEEFDTSPPLSLD